MNLTLFLENDRITMQFNAGESLREIFHRNNIYVDMPCGGNGSCGKCRIRYDKGAPEPLLEERTLLSDKELEKGFRLFCVSSPEKDCAVELHFHRAETDAVSDFQGGGTNRESEANGIAVDIGTTTVAFALIQGGKTVYTDSMENSQRAFGADVISRIRAAEEGKAEALQERIREDLSAGITALVKKSYEVIEQIVIAGNTTMLHLLLGYSCVGLGKAPFTPVTLQEEQTTLKRILPEYEFLPPETRVTILPGISAFVGSDVTAGLLYLGAGTWKKPTLFVDLGTNAEMAAGTGKGLVTASAAAGPAFEGGRLSCGMGSVEGAVCSVWFDNSVPKIKTIGDAEPAGICGTGVVETLYGLREQGYMDITGLLKEPYFTEGFSVYTHLSVFARTVEEELKEDIKLTQKDIREVQMAKSAIRTGIEILLKSGGYRYEDIAKVYIAGGFGYRLDVAKAAAVGLIPKELADRTEAVGNTSLGGAVEYLIRSREPEKLEEELAGLTGNAREIVLAEDEDFHDDYLKYMFF